MVRSPAKKMSRNGLKINPRKDEGQKTLSEAFAAGNLIKEAKTQRQEMLKAQEEILVSSRVTVLERLNLCDDIYFQSFQIFREKPILQGESLAFQG